MTKWLLNLAVLLSALSLVAQNVQKSAQIKEPPVLGPHWAKDAAHPRSQPSAGDMSYHGGPILPGVTVRAIFWGPSWPTYTGDEITGLDKWYTYVGTTGASGGSSYEATVNEYNDSAGQSVTTAITYQGHVVDGSSLPRRSPSAVLAEVCRQVPRPVANGYYPVYVDHKRGSVGYCAYHSWGSCNGTPIEFGFFFKLDGDAGCDPRSTVSGQSQGLQASANVTGHELSEVRSDPYGTAWYDSSGAENGDKCAWTFGGPFVTFLDGTKWKIQGNWSNYAFDHNTGYPNSSGQNGCADGTNVPGPFTR